MWPAEPAGPFFPRGWLLPREPIRPFVSSAAGLRDMAHGDCFLFPQRAAMLFLCFPKAKVGTEELCQDHALQAPTHVPPTRLHFATRCPRGFHLLKHQLTQNLFRRNQKNSTIKGDLFLLAEGWQFGIKKESKVRHFEERKRKKAEAKKAEKES